MEERKAKKLENEKKSEVVQTVSIVRCNSITGSLLNLLVLLNLGRGPETHQY